MPVENATYINQLNPDWPVGKSDFVSQGDDHIRMLKSSLQNTFSRITGPITATQDQINNVATSFTWDDVEDAGASDYWFIGFPGSQWDYAPLMMSSPSIAQYAINPDLSITFRAIINIIYPVGSAYISFTDNRNPHDILGFGTWVAVTGLIAAAGAATGEDGTTYTYKFGAAGLGRVRHSDMEKATYEVALTMDEMDEHTHGVKTYSAGESGLYNLSTDGPGNEVDASGGILPASAGTPTGKGSVDVGGETTTYAPIYTGAYIWRRTA